ncbi:MAG: hypothetical protein KME11_04930 [Timaviella obliquedivisa GSE-PSE-MK23-08B]|nr:hypothetical protein [Timaviella obliquedivisa GSE-PSE-MK23-08B]
MPLELSRYPKDWKRFSHRLKQQAGWQCQWCDRPCRQPQESWLQFKLRVWYAYPLYQATKLYCEIDQNAYYFLLSLAHLDQDPGNSQPDNLRCLCLLCHLNYDRQFFHFNRQTKQERRGQLNFFKPELLFAQSLAGKGKDPSRIQLAIPKKETPSRGAAVMRNCQSSRK